MTSHPRSSLARALYYLSTLALIAYPVALLWNLLIIPDIGAAYVAAFPALTISAPPAGARLVALLLLDTVEIALTLLIVWHVRDIFRSFSRSVDPTVEVARRLSLVGVLLLVQALVAIIFAAFESVLLTWANGPGLRSLSISISSSEIALVIAGGLLLCVGRALGSGAAAVDENRGFV